MRKKPVASLSFDLDNQWTYMRMHGIPGWEQYPSYLDLVVPRILDFLADRELTATFFVIGRDAASPQNRQALRAIASAGHEIGSHSYDHDPGFHLWSADRIDAELARAEEHIQATTGRRPVGFRAPGYKLSSPVLQALARRGYLYDASTYPTFLGPLAQAYFFATTRLSPRQKRERKVAFGTLRDGLRPLRPYRWRVADQQNGLELVEIPVTTMPILRAPIHLTYVLYLSRVSPLLGLNYLRVGLLLCRATGTPPSLLLHPLDFLGCDDLESLTFFPAMDMAYEAKSQIVGEVMRLLCSQFRVTTLERRARSRAAGLRVQSVKLGFPAR
jgi:hypothetical protein